MPLGHITDTVLRTEGLPLGDVRRAILRRLLMYCHTNPDTKPKWINNHQEISRRYYTVFSKYLCKTKRKVLRA
jgi:hypothetical protein